MSEDLKFTNDETQTGEQLRNWSNKAQDILNEEIGQDRQLEIFRKYGVSEELIKTMTEGNVPEEKKDEAFTKIIGILADKLLDGEVEVEDMEVVNAITGARLGFNL